MYQYFYLFRCWWLSYFHHCHCHCRLIVAQIYCWYFVEWGTTSSHYLVLYYINIFYLILISLPLTGILYIVVVVAAVLQVPCWSITQFAFRSYGARIHTFPSLEPSGRVLCCAFIDALGMGCDFYWLTLLMCVLLLLLGWHCHPLWFISYPHG